MTTPPINTPLSIPSKVFAVVDVPEVTTLDGEFVYAFFEPDEMINDSGNVNSKTKTGEQLALDQYHGGRQVVPRFVALDWSLVPPTPLSDKTLTLPPGMKLADNLGKIYNEADFVADNYTSMCFQQKDQGVNAGIFVRQLFDEVTKYSRQEEAKRFLGNESITSPLDQAKVLYEVLPEDTTIEPETLTKTLTGRPQDKGYFFENVVPTEREEVGIYVHANTKFVHDLLKGSTETTLSDTTNELQTGLRVALQAQERAIADRSSSRVVGSDYDFQVTDLIDVVPVDTNAYKPSMSIIGYIINKKEYTLDGKVVDHHPIVIESPTISTCADLQVKYGSRYEYTIQSVALLSIQASDSDVSEVVAVRFLVSSKPSLTRVIECLEQVAPPPPADFKVEWDYMKNMPRLSWAFPPNAQRDIKYFQVFRRRSIFEPFEMVKMYDFNTLLPNPDFWLAEPVEAQLWERVSSPVLIYLDNKFTEEETLAKKPEWIYTVSCIDAHGFCSNYAMQYRVRFNRFSNKLEKDLVSLSGAPKAYPNMILQVDTFVDTIRDSGHEKLTVAFAPEYSSVVDNLGVKTDLFKTTGEGTCYKLQLINVDSQESATVDIQVRNLTKR